jgi:hypothetical protein
MAASQQRLSYYYELKLLLSFMMKVKSNRSKKSKNYADPEGAVISTRWIESSLGILGLRLLSSCFTRFRLVVCWAVKGLSGKEFCEYAASSSL